jgi:hypothetical protein
MVTTDGLHVAHAINVEEGFGARLLERIRQLICGMHGHDTFLQFEHDRLFLRCVSCGHQTSGWELTEAPPTVTVRGDARRHALARPKLVSARRVA